MKNILNYVMLATVAAAALVSCAKEQQSPEESTTPAMKTITITTNVQTKSTLDAAHQNLVWSSGDKISVFNDQDDSNAQLAYAANGYMTIEVPSGTSEVFGHYPYYSGNTSGPSSVSVYISKSQTQKNPGELAGNYYPMVAKGTVTSDNKANMVFYPIASALALNIYHTGLVGTEKVSKVVVTPAAANTLFTGSQNTDITADNVKYTSAASSDPITVTLTNALTLDSTKPTDAQTFGGQIYVCLAKQSYASVKFEITTTKGVYTITSNTTPFDCENNDFVPVNINLSKAAFVPNEYPDEPTSGNCWYRVECADWLSANDRVVIVNHDGTQALGTVKKSNNRDGVEVSISDDGDYKKLTPNNNMQVFILEDGTVDGSFAFWCENGDEPSKYMYAASSDNNYLKFQNNKDANASFIPTIVNGLGYLTAQGTNSRNTLRYNNSNNSNLFSCYSGTSNNDISIYKYYGTWPGSTTCADPTITQTDNTITIESTTPGVTIYYTTDGTDPDKTNNDQKYTHAFSITSPLTVKAIAVRSHYTDSGISSKACTVTVATPVISSTGTSFSITCATDGATIYYKTSTTSLDDIAEPLVSPATYSAAVSYTATTYVKAYAVKEGYTSSAIASATCTYSSGGDDSVVYTLTPAAGSNTSYNSNCDVTVGNITWNVEGNANYTNNNSVFQGVWRVGGKSISAVDRAIYSKTALSNNISKIEIKIGATNITVNSFTVIVATDPDFNSVVSTLTPSFAANSTITVNRPGGVNWSNCYYKFVFNVTNTVNSNKYASFAEAKFTGK